MSATDEKVTIKIGAFGIQGEELQHMEPGSIQTVSKQFAVELVHAGRATEYKGEEPAAGADLASRTRTR